MRTNGTPAVVSAGKQLTLSSMITSGRCRSMICFNCGSQYIAPSIKCLPRRLHESAELIERRGAEHRLGVADEVGPELTGGLLGRVGGRRRREVDEILDEPERLEPAGPRCLGGEHHPVAVLAQQVADADAVVRRPVGTLRHEQEGGHGYRSSVMAGASIELAQRLLGQAVFRRAADHRRSDQRQRGRRRVGGRQVVAAARARVRIPGVELIRHLTAAGFDEMPAFVGTDERDGVVHAIVTAYLPGRCSTAGIGTSTMSRPGWPAQCRSRS